MYEDLVNAARELANKLSKAVKLPEPERQKKVVEIGDVFTTLADRLINTKIFWRDTAAQAMIRRDLRLLEATIVCLDKDLYFLELIPTNVQVGFVSNPAKIKKLTNATEDLLSGVIELRSLIERKIVEPPSWWAKRRYSTARRIRKIRKKSDDAR